MTKAENTAEVDPDPASSRVPLDVDDEGAVTGPNDQIYDGLNLDPEAHASKIAGAQAVETGPWMVSDGQTLAAVDSDSVLWTQDLDSSAAEVTGLGDKRVTPSWAAVDGVLIIGTSDKVKGLDVSTGDQLWAVSAPTDGFAVAGSQLRIQHEGAVSSFDFTDSSDDETVTADKGFDETISALPAPKLPSEDDIHNAELEVPPACADLTMAEGAKQDFTDGRAPEGDYGESVAINDVTTSLAAPKPMVAIDFVCYPGGNWVTDSVGVYDQKLDLVTSIEPWGADSDVQQLSRFQPQHRLCGRHDRPLYDSDGEQYRRLRRTRISTPQSAQPRQSSASRGRREATNPRMCCSTPTEPPSGSRRSRRSRSSSMRPRKATMTPPVRWPLMRSCATWTRSSGTRPRTHR
jgi:hypothetical protein